MQSKQQEERRNSTINGENYGNWRRSFHCYYMVMVYVAEETNILIDVGKRS